MSVHLDDATAGDGEVVQSLMPLVLILAGNLPVLLGVPFFAAVIAVIYSVLSDPIYTATTRILPPQYNENTVMAMQNQLGGESQLGNSALTLKNPNDLFVGILTSRTIVDAVVERHDLQDYYDMVTLGDARKKLAGATQVKSSKNGIVSVSVEDTSRDMAARLANAYVDEFYAFSQKLARSQAERRSAFYSQSLDNARRKLGEADIAFAEMKKTTGLTGLLGQEQSIVLAAAELQAQIAAREVQLKTLRTYAAPGNPDVQLLKREIANLNEQLETLSRFRTDNSRRGDDGLPRLSETPDALMVFSQRKREVEYWENVVDLIGRFGELGKIDERRDLSLFQILDKAIPPEDKSKPRTKVNAILAALGSGFLCLISVLARAYVQQRIEQSARFAAQWRELKSTVSINLSAQKKA